MAWQPRGGNVPLQVRPGARPLPRPLRPTVPNFTTNFSNDRLNPDQRSFMAEIVRGMQTGDIGTVANALSGAVSVSVSIPDAFLGTVKQWMDSRQQSAAASMHMSQMFYPAATPPGPAPMGQAPVSQNSFNQLHQQLEEAIKRNDTTQMSTILQQAAQLAATGGAESGNPLAPSVLGGVIPQLMSTLSGASAQLPLQGAMPMLQQPMGGLQPTSLWQPPLPAGLQPPPSGPGQVLGTVPQAHQAGALTTAPNKKRRGGEHSPTWSPTFNASDEEGQPQQDKASTGNEPFMPENSTPLIGTKPTVGKRGTKRRASGEKRAQIKPVLANVPQSKLSTSEGFAETYTKTTLSMPSYGAYEPFADTGMEGLQFEPSAEEIADFLRSVERDTATFRQICSHFTPSPSSEYIRRTVENRPMLFSVSVDRVTLRDPHKKEALNCFARELVRAPLTRQQIKPDDAHEPVGCAANFALQASPEDVAKMLLNVSKKTLKKIGKVKKGVHPANMPLVLACIVDRIVAHERSRRGSRIFEDTLGSLIYEMIFEKWVFGVVPGSQFLANMLLRWERQGYFKVKHIEKCKKPLWLLIAYARSDGVPDAPDRDSGTGWYKFFQDLPPASTMAEAKSASNKMELFKLGPPENEDSRENIPPKLNVSNQKAIKSKTKDPVRPASATQDLHHGMLESESSNNIQLPLSSTNPTQDVTTTRTLLTPDEATLPPRADDAQLHHTQSTQSAAEGSKTDMPPLKQPHHGEDGMGSTVDASVAVTDAPVPAM